MIIIKILLGLFAFSFIVFIHELGHMLAARRMGIVVTAFSIGWGKVLLRKTYKGIEYRLSLIPLGGYCKLQGESAYVDAWEKKEKSLDSQEGDFHYASPLKRIITAAAGPAANLLLAFVIFSFFWLIGYEQSSYSNRIVLASEINGETWPADAAGLQSGDRIITIEGERVHYFRDIQSAVATKPDQPLTLQYLRDDTAFSTTLTPSLNKSTGGALAGIYPWIPLTIDTVQPQSPADKAGLQPGDTLLSADGTPLIHFLQLQKIIEAKNSQSSTSVELTYQRGSSGSTKRTTLEWPMILDQLPRLGIDIAPESYTTRAPHLPAALYRGAEETFGTLWLTIKSLGLLFRGVDLSQAVAGPIRLTYIMGNVATQSISAGFSRGAHYFFQFMAFISIALCFMNLLPIPVLDGGQILLALIQCIKRKPLKPSFVMGYQFVGTALILLLIVFATTNDLLFLARQ